jgi:hypothetical protein
VPHGAAASTSCEQGVQGNVEVEPHFSNPAVPEPVFTDPDTTVDPNLSNRCGSLVFNNRTRVATTVYATQSDPGENPWKYWWRRARYRDNGTGVLTEVRKVSVGPDTLDTAVVELPLSAQYDAIGVVLIIDSSASRQISDLPFTSTTPGPWGDVNFKFQHWREITPPSVTSVTHEGGIITLAWHNEHQGRSIDSTVIYRNASQLTVVAGADSTYTHESPGNGIWTYTLKHVSWPAALAPPRELAFPNSDTSNAITITLGTACARWEDTSYATTLQYADQYLSAGCSELGAHKRFRWYGAGDVPLTAWSGDTLLDFPGHADTGTQLVILRDSNTTTHATARDTLSFAVSRGHVTLTGETYIPDKATYVYASTQLGHWFERYEDGPLWYPATAYEQESLTRIWPKGDYTVDLRQHRFTGVLRRGRLMVQVCSVAGCSPPIEAPQATADVVADWGLFGAGPWLGWGGADLRRTLRYYDLWGMPDRASPFAEPTWLTGEGGRVRDAETGWQVDWAPRTVPHDDVRALEFAVAGTAGRPSVFSLAVDPDLGADAADDVASYDRERGLVVVADGERAVGFLLRAGGANALASVQEYGVGRWAPTVPATAWAAQREPGIHLRGIPGDVQLLLSAPPVDGGGTWTFVVLRGSTPAAVRARAEEVRHALR